MGTLQEKHDALKLVADAAKIHSDNLRESLNEDRHFNRSFNSSRAEYINKVNFAISTVRALKFDETLKVSERVADLDLAESVDLLHAVEDHIRKLRQYSRSDLR